MSHTIQAGFPYDEIVAHCKQEYPREACGYVAVKGNAYLYIKCLNTARNPLEDFAIALEQQSNIEDNFDVVVFVHSHTNGNDSPSPDDIQHQKGSGIDWLIVSLHNKDSIPTFSWIRDNQSIKELYQREYIWHVRDCGTFVQDFYKQEFNIELPDFYRPSKFWESGLEVYLHVYAKAGFHKIDFKSLQYGDVILFALGTAVTTHGAVYLGGNKIGHHYRGRLSCKEDLNSYYINRATMFLRHKDRDNAEDNKIIRSIG